MEIAISTASLHPSSMTALERAAALGFSQLEVNLQPEEFGYGYKRKTDARFFRGLAQRLAGGKLDVWSTTTPALTQLQMFSPQARRDILFSSAIAAGLLGSRVLVTTGPDIFGDEDRLQHYFEHRLAPPVIAGFDEAWAQAVNRRVSLALRNQDYWIGAPLLNRPERLEKVATDLAIGLALDVRQALRRGDLAAWLEHAGDRLAVAYVYDLDGAERLCAPRDPAWREWLAALRATRLKAIVLQANPAQSDDAIRQSHAFVRACLDRAES